MAKRKIDSDNFIKRLQNENSGIRQDLATRTTLEQFLEKMNTKTETTPKIDLANVPDNQPATPVDPNAIKQLIAQSLNEEREVRKQNDNFQMVVDYLQVNIGDSYPQVLEEKRKELGLSREYMENLARTQPKVLLSLVAVPNEKQSIFGNNPKQTSLTELQPKKTNNTKGFSHFKKMRQEDPAKYWSPAVQNEMFRLTSEQGETFLNS